MKPKCEECKYWVYTHVGLREDKIWHCRDGFKPYNNKWGCCQDLCKRNDRFKEDKKRIAYYNSETKRGTKVETKDQPWYTFKEQSCQ